MGLKRILLVINQLVEFWKKQNIIIYTKTKQEIDNIEKNNSLILPNDFKEFYERVNGMQNFYPNEIDDEGFLFYPIEAIISAEKESEKCDIKDKDKIFIFSEYMHKSWLYGFEVKEDGSYLIGIIPDDKTFKPIVKSLEEFLELYIENSSKLYDYS
ncbi:SMI1/KNR4 family protein [Sphingobacterium sp. SRCM116780]|uniref:SMI1/KNR4 family protein n=1 Tax=Sphingobacterium sp. SRCM116780 TaxID=2907623 RepID=UPI001F3E3893|nr:SMI1/KNR4 family protein [Sphingobacterium sp. SRCM116780]UIR56449.1 SMI1/KNR4 family protein [Sphingobacterium sp. SRCM116780]